MLYTELKTLTESCNTIKEISISAGKSETTIKYWLKKHDLKIIKAKVYEKICSDCKTLKPLSEYYLKNKEKQSYNSYCKDCSKTAATKSKRNFKDDCIDYKGGSCINCGYSKCRAALEFHHLESDLKEFELSRKTNLNNEVKLELDKCILVCANCHREIHNNFGGTDKI